MMGMAVLRDGDEERRQQAVLFGGDGKVLELQLALL